MTMHLPDLYHWSPAANHKNIQKRGLRPTTETTVTMHPVPPNIGHHEGDDKLEGVLAVCLGTSASTAWGLSGAWSAELGSVWDLWQVVLTEDDEVHIRTEYGPQAYEVRVLGKIPRSRIWYVGSRVVRESGSRWYA